MKVTDFDYELPEELIAQHPVEPRDTARLLTLDKVTGEVAHKEHFYDLLDELHEGRIEHFNVSKGYGFVKDLKNAEKIGRAHV